MALKELKKLLCLEEKWAPVALLGLSITGRSAVA